MTSITTPNSYPDWQQIYMLVKFTGSWSKQVAKDTSTYNWKKKKRPDTGRNPTFPEQLIMTNCSNFILRLHLLWKLKINKTKKKWTVSKKRTIKIRMLEEKGAGNEKNKSRRKSSLSCTTSVKTFHTQYTGNKRIALIP